MDYDALFKAQEGRCAICQKQWEPVTKAGRKARRMHRDHDHEKLIPRGLLCGKCNRHLKQGYNAEWYLQAHKYLLYYE